MYMNQNLLINEYGTPIKILQKIKVSFLNFIKFVFKLILIMEDDQLSICQKYRIFSKKFSTIYMKSLSEENFLNIIEQVIEWHLATK